MKCILTVVGMDKPGIIARVSGLLSENNVNIEDISQTIMQNTFTMIMLINLSSSKATIASLSQECKNLGKEIGVSILLQHEDIFNAMHKV